MWIKLGVYAKFVHFFMRDGSYMDVEGIPGIHKCDIHLSYMWDQQQHDYWA